MIEKLMQTMKSQFLYAMW